MKPKIPVKWEIIDIMFIRKNFPVMTWNELLDAVNKIRSASQQIELSALRHQVKRMGLKKGIQIRWSSDDINFLLSNYTKMGNVEIAAKLNKKHRTFRIIDGKKVYRTFNKKHVEKKMKLLGLHRTRKQILNVKQRNLKTTNYRVLTHEDNLWSRGIRKAAPEEDVRIWKGKRFVKVNGHFTPYTRWFYHNFIERVPEGYTVYHKDFDVLNDHPDNLACSPRTGLQSLDRYKKALVLLANREKQILEKLPKMSYDKQKAEVRQMHADLNRVRSLQVKINQRLNKPKQTAS